MARTTLFRALSRLMRRSLNQSVNERLRHSAGTLEKSAETLTLNPSITRRQFLKMTAGGLAAAVMVPSLSGLHTAFGASSQPVVIIGAGAAGFTAAYRLHQQGIPCQIYEGNNRVGGRMFTHNNFNKEGMFCELGGELVDTGHEDLIALCGELGVPLEDFRPGDRNVVGTLYYFDDRFRTEEEVLQAFEPLAKELIKDIESIYPDGEIVMPTYQEPMGAEWLDYLSLEGYLHSKPDIEPWLINMLKVAYTGEYGLDPAEQSALNILLLINPDTRDGFQIYGVSDEAMRIKGGSSQLIHALHEKIKPHVPVYTENKLTAIEDTVKDGQPQFNLTFTNGCEVFTVPAQQVILALPFSVLRNIQGVLELKLSDVKKQSIAELGYGTNSKQMLGFTDRFWRKPQGEIPASTGAIFADVLCQAFWETSRLQPGTAGIITNFMGGDIGKSAVPDEGEQSLNNLEIIWPGASTHYDGNHALFNWATNPFSAGSYFCPRPGQYTTLIGSAHEPELENRLFFAGEHCSLDWPGYMNGAVQSGNVVAQQIQETKGAVTRQAALAAIFSQSAGIAVQSEINAF